MEHENPASQHTAQRKPCQHYPGPAARQGTIILREPWQKTLFIAGLAGAVVLAILIVIVT